jgi:hypothetical protein
LRLGAALRNIASSSSSVIPESIEAEQIVASPPSPTISLASHWKSSRLASLSGST